MQSAERTGPGAPSVAGGAMEGYPARHHGGRAAMVASGVGLVALIALAYANSLHGPFVYDDPASITYNASIRHLWPLGGVLHPPGGAATVSGRPVLNLSFALNYVVGGTNVVGYHLTNIAIHALAALVLFGLVRRTLLRSRLGNRLGRATTGAAFFVAAIWAMHPLLTEAVTYTVQRAESLMSLFFLLTLYGVAGAAEEREGVGNRTDRSDRSDLRSRAAGTVAPTGTGETPAGSSRAGRPCHDEPSAPRWGWLAVSWVACLLGMATKENMVAAPVIVLLYDRAFVAGSFSAAWRARRWFYLGLAATWLLLGALVLSTGGNRGGSAGLGVGVSATSYLLTQVPALARYAMLVVWPHPLIFDYGIVTPHLTATYVAQAIAVLGAIAAGLWAVWRRPQWGFAIAVALALLAPTSLVPGTTQMIVEHRMYLPAAALLCLLLPIACVAPRRLLAVATTAAVVALTLTTAARNRAYHSAVALWADTVAKRPDNAVAHGNLGSSLRDAGQPDAAIAECRRALELKPDYPQALGNLGVYLSEKGKPEEALPLIERAIALQPDSAMGYLYAGVTLSQLNRPPEALARFADAVRLNPLLPLARYRYGDALAAGGRLEDAAREFEATTSIDPTFSDAYMALAGVQVRRGDIAAANQAFARAARLRPDDGTTQLSWGNYLATLGRPTDAVPQLTYAVQRQPASAFAHYSLGLSLAALSRYDEAIAEFQRAVLLQPEYAEAYNNLGNVLSSAGRLSEAVAPYERSLALRPSDAPTHNNLGLALARLGRVQEALPHFEAAVRLDPTFTNARENLARAQAQLESKR